MSLVKCSTLSNEQFGPLSIFGMREWGCMIIGRRTNAWWIPDQSVSFDGMKNRRTQRFITSSSRSTVESMNPSTFASVERFEFFQRLQHLCYKTQENFALGSFDVVRKLEKYEYTQEGSLLEGLCHFVMPLPDGNMMRDIIRYSSVPILLVFSSPVFYSLSWGEEKNRRTMSKKFDFHNLWYKKEDTSQQ